MLQNCYHGILVDAAFTNKSFPNTFKLFARKHSGDWTLFGVEIPRDGLDQTIQSIQAEMRADEPFYGHLYDDETLIVIFKKPIFRVTPHNLSWDVIKGYGKSLNIPEEQLDFWPNRFQDEIHYFDRADFV
jgi:hypothetical protein